MTKVDDSCKNRGEIAPGTWVRNGSTDSHGGPLISANFEPMFSFTLPKGHGSAGAAMGSSAAERRRRDVQGLAGPRRVQRLLQRAKGTKVLERGIDPFLPVPPRGSGLTISNQRESTIDGHRAVIVDIVGKD